MNNRLADSLFRMSGLATGMQPYTWLDRLEEMQWWGRPAMLEWQAQQLRAMLEHSLGTVPYYRRVLANVPDITAENVASVLTSLPILTKDDVRQAFDALQSTAYSQRQPLEISTSGSTGQRVTLRVDRPAFARYFAAKFRALRWYGVGFADRQIRAWGLPLGRSEQLAVRARDVLQNRLRLVAYDLSEKTLARFYDRCLSFRPVYMNGYTTAMWPFADFIIRSGRDGAALGLRLVVATASVMYDWQRRRISEAFGCPVVDEYGCGELQAIAYDCPAGRRHITHENVLVEVLDDSGKPTPPGQPGRLTLTSLCNRAMPLIRYQNGDIAELEADGGCPCGRHPGLPTLKRIVGRTNDVLFRADGQRSHCGAVYYAINEAFEPGMLIEYQARQKSYDLIEMSVVRGSKYDDEAMARFVRRLQALLGPGLEFDVKFVEKIAREKSGKMAYFVSDLPEARLGETSQQ